MLVPVLSSIRLGLVLLSRGQLLDATYLDDRRGRLFNRWALGLGRRLWSALGIRLGRRLSGRRLGDGTL